MRVLLAEAASEGEEGMYHVASVMQNRATRRKTDLDTEATRPFQFTGALRKDLGRFVASQPKETHDAARRAMERATKQPASTATHYMTTKLYTSSKRPGWAKKMRVLGVVGAHTFLEDPTFR